MSIRWSKDGSTIYSGNCNGIIRSWNTNLGRSEIIMSV